MKSLLVKLLAVALTSLAAVSAPSPAFARDCHGKLEPISAIVSRVIDGDTIELATGQRVRIVGMDTREMDASDPQDKHWAQQAKIALEAIVDNESNVTLLLEKERKDRYDRLLAHVRFDNGIDASGELIARGLAIAVAVGKNTACAMDNMILEALARSSSLGLWSTKGAWWSDSHKPLTKARGFHVVRTSVNRRLGQGRKSALELSNGVKVTLGRHWPLNKTQTDALLENLEQQRIEVRGWIGGRNNALTLSLHHPANLALIGR